MLRSFRIHQIQLLQQGLHTLFFHPALQGLPVAGGGEVGKVVALDETVHVQSGAAGNDGGFAPGHDVVYNGSGHLAVAADGEIFLRLCHVDHVVDNALHFFHSGLGGADVHAPVHIHGVAGNNFTVKFLGQFHSQGSLAGGGRPRHTNNVIQIGTPPSAVRS